MGRESIVTAPDGGRWRVRRRWVERPLPNLRRRFKANRKEAADGMEWLPLDGIGSPAAMIAGVVFIALLVLVVLPLLGVALELIALLLLIASGLFGRVVLRRPWIVTAEKLGDPEERIAFAVKGWRDSSEALRELRTTIAAAGPPERLAHGKPLATRPVA
jgi:hypothetical protein